MPMKSWMSPKEYFQVLFKIFFKVISFEEEVKNWNESNRFRVSTGSLIYNFGLSIILYTIFIIITNNDSFVSENFFMVISYVVLIDVIGIIIGIAFAGIIGEIAFVFIFSILFIIFYGLSTEGLLINFLTPENIINTPSTGTIFGILFGITLGIVFSFGAVNRRTTFATIFGYIGGIIGGIIYFLLLNPDIDVSRMRGSIRFSIYFTLFYFIFSGKLFYYPFFWSIKGSSSMNPLRWDENIALPIPFLSQLILHYRNTEGIETASKFAVFLVENRPIHREYAQISLLILASDVMKNFTRVEQIAYFQKELDFMPPSENLPEDYPSALLDLSIISKDVRFALNDYNQTNKLRQYQRVQTNIQIFQKKSNISSQGSYVQFNKVGKSWQNIIHREIRHLEISRGKPLPNPFVTGPPLYPEDAEVFVGRQDIITVIQTETLREGVTGAILFTGSRRTGKSSTLLNLNRFLPSSLQAIYFDCQSPKITTSLSQFCNHIAQEINLKIPGLKQQKLPNDLTNLSDWLDAAEQYLQTKNKSLLLCIDEYERLGKLINEGTLRGLADALRSWVQRYRHLTFLFAGSHELRELSDIDWTDYLINVRTVFISYLDEAAALKLVTKPVPEFDLQYQPDDLRYQLVQRLGRQPYLVQCTMSEMVEALNNDSNRKFAKQSDIQKAIEQVFITAQQYFEHFWEKEISEEARQLLLPLAKGQQVDGDSPIAKRLIRKEILRREKGQLEFCVPVLRDWIIAYW